MDEKLPNIQSFLIKYLNSNHNVVHKNSQCYVKQIFLSLYEALWNNFDILTSKKKTVILPPIFSPYLMISYLTLTRIQFSGHFCNFCFHLLEVYSQKIICFSIKRIKKIINMFWLLLSFQNSQNICHIRKIKIKNLKKSKTEFIKCKWDQTENSEFLNFKYSPAF